MANILDQYGIKEVADVTLYLLDADGLMTTPVLYLDTLKVSTIEQTAEQTEARGGKGNSPLIIWDFGKEITISLEDALFTPKSMGVMFGSTTALTALDTSVATVTQMKRVADATAYSAPTNASVVYWDAILTTSATTVGALTGQIFVQETYDAANTYTIEISAAAFPGTYGLVGDTYARNKNSGVDEYFQFVVPQAKMGAENTITLEAEGDPSVFNFTMRVLRPTDGIMMKLIKYTLD